jgi:hypothetical protein
MSECASCGIKADMRCVGCLNAPEHHPGDATSTIYCSRTCQTQHWRKHKVRCRALSRRVKLLRAAHIFKAALLTYREVFYDIDLKKVELRDDALYLHQRLRSVTTRTQIVRFPAHLTTNIEHREAALLNNQCTLAMALLGRLVRRLLDGTITPLQPCTEDLKLNTYRTSLYDRSTRRSHWKATSSYKTRSRPRR